MGSVNYLLLCGNNRLMFEAELLFTIDVFLLFGNKAAV